MRKRILIIVIASIVIITGYKIINIVKERKEVESFYEEANENISFEYVKYIPYSNNENYNIDDEDNSLVEYQIVNVHELETLDDKLLSLKVDWNEFNDNVIGWIYIDDTPISYPVVQSFDNFYYLDHLYNDEYNKVGSIFVDYRNDGFNNSHTIIYGHNTKSGSMFGSLSNYLKEDYLEEHKYIYITTPDNGSVKYMIFNCFLTDARGEADGYSAYKVYYNNNEEWLNWIASSIDRAYVKNVIQTNRNIITLSTCMSRGNDMERLIIQAIEINRY